MDQYRRGELVFDVVDEGPPAGPVVVLLHSFPQSNTGWDDVIPRLTAQGYRCLAHLSRICAGFTCTSGSPKHDRQRSTTWPHADDESSYCFAAHKKVTELRLANRFGLEQVLTWVAAGRSRHRSREGR
jgi:hypothetical protein